MKKEGWKLELANSYIDKWASEKPHQAAMIQSEDGKTVTYQEFANSIDLYALRLLEMGIRKGDRVATMLLTTTEHLVLMYACFKIGAIFAPVDIRLKEDEVVRDLNKIDPAAFFFLGTTPLRDFSEVGKAVKEGCTSVKLLVQFSQDPEQIIEGAYSIYQFSNRDELGRLRQSAEKVEVLNRIYKDLNAKTPAMIIYTTGTTGEPKPAVLNHENIIVQNEVLSRGINIYEEDFRFVVNLPQSHVGGTTEGPMTSFYVGGTAILLRIFDASSTLKAIEDYKATIIGMIPTQYRLLWNVPNYQEFNLDSLKFAVYAGAPGDEAFLEKLFKMAPKVGTGLGMTENAGFATFTPQNTALEEMIGQVGTYFPDVAKVSVRKPMDENGLAGEELPDGEVGEICYHPPIVFPGYFNQPEKTSQTISKEGILYTGDLGLFKDKGDYRALYLAGRKKFVIKQKGYNVFPDEVQNYISKHPKVSIAEIVGIPHAMFDEVVFAFVQPKKDEILTAEEIMEYCQNLTSYKRPQFIEIWPFEKPLPLTRVGKMDKIALREEAIRLSNEAVIK